MTVIAYRDGVMAADTLTCLGDLRVSYGPKIIRGPGGTIAAASGSAGSAAKFGAWLMAGEIGAFDPDAGDMGFSAVVVRPDGAVWLMERSGALLPSRDIPFVADGSGWEVAIGAMEMGATAEQAVAAAIKHVTSCGGPIQVERLRP